MNAKRSVQIDIDSAIRISSKHIIRELSGGKLVFFCDLPNWVVFSDEEFDVFCLLQDLTIRDAISRTSEKRVVTTLRKLLSRKILNTKNKGNGSNITRVLPMFIYLTNKCNLRCKHCYMYSGGPLEHEMTFGEWKDVIGGFIEYDGKELIISGGEPLLVSYFTALAEWTKERAPELRIRLFTNGTFLDKLSLEFLNRNISEIQVSIDGTTAEIHDHVRGKGHFSRVMGNLTGLADFQGIVTISMSILDDVDGEVFATSFQKFFGDVKGSVPNAKFKIVTNLLDGRCCNKLEFNDAESKFGGLLHVLRENVKESDSFVEEETELVRNHPFDDTSWDSACTPDHFHFLWAGRPRTVAPNPAALASVTQAPCP